MTKYTFKIKNNPSTFFTPSNKSTNYSKILDDLILDDLIKKNSWLNTKTTTAFDIPTTTKINIKLDNSKDLYSKVCKFFADKDELKKTFIKDKIYYLADGTPFYITDDYITIGFNTYYFYEFNTPKFFADLSDDIKKTICTIYVDGLKITIKK